MTKTDEIYKQLRNDIFAVRLAPGSPLKLSKLCEDYRITITPLREAMQRLEKERLVELTPNVGFRVAPVSPVELLELTKTKTYLELNLLRESMAFGDVDWEAKIIATHYTLSREEPNLEPENNPEGFTSWSIVHEAFHESLICANKSPWLFRFYRQATEHIRRHGRALRYTNPYVHSGTAVDAMQASPSLQNSSWLELHTDLKDAVIKRQNDKAEMLLIKHNDLTVLAYKELGIFQEDMI